MLYSGCLESQEETSWDLKRDACRRAGTKSKLLMIDTAREKWKRHISGNLLEKAKEKEKEELIPFAPQWLIRESS